MFPGNIQLLWGGMGGLIYTLKHRLCTCFLVIWGVGGLIFKIKALYRLPDNILLQWGRVVYFYIQNIGSV